VSIICFSNCNTRVSDKKIAATDTIASGLPIQVKSERQLFKHFGEQLNISGDFDGDAKTDTLFESYISSLTGEETSKQLDTTDWENNVDLIVKISRSLVSTQT
jgi:hypothetical protein